MKKLLLSILAIFNIEQIMVSKNVQPSSMFNSFTNKAQLTDEEVLAGLKLLQSIPASEEPFDLSIKSQQDEICYELKSDKNYVYNCMHKKRTAELIIAYIQVCIEQNLESELKKAKKLLHQLLNASEGSTLTVTSNGYPAEGMERNIKLKSPTGQISAHVSDNKDINNPNLTKEKFIFELNTQNIILKNESYSVRKYVSPTLFSYSPESSFRWALKNKKTNSTEQISVTHEKQPTYDSQDGLHHEKIIATVNLDTQETGSVTLTAQGTSQGKNCLNLDSEKSINLTTENSTINAEWSTNKNNEITSHNISSKYKKPETQLNSSN